MRHMILTLVLASSLLLGGCAWSIGGKSEKVIQQPTLGQELIDLKSALDKHAITESEYQQVKAKLLNGEGND